MVQYKITKEDFLEMAEYILRKKTKQKGYWLKLFVMTVGVMGVALWMFFGARELPAWLRVAVLGVSVLITTVAVFQNGFYGLRSKMALSQQESRDQAGEFWKEHKLSLQGNILQISYGASSGKVDCRHIEGWEESETLRYLIVDGSVIEAIPKKVCETEQWKELFEKIEETSQKSRRQVKDDARKSAADNNARFSEWIVMTEDEVADELVRLKRHSYTTIAGWNGMTFFGLIFPLILVIYSAVLQQWGYTVLCFILMILCNIHFFITFSPFCRKNIRKKVEPPTDEGYLLTVAGGKITLVTRDNSYNYDIRSIRKTVNANTALYLYFSGQQMLFVPKQYAEAFMKALSERRSISEKAKLPQ